DEAGNQNEIEGSKTKYYGAEQINDHDRTGQDPPTVINTPHLYHYSPPRRARRGGECSLHTFPLSRYKKIAWPCQEELSGAFLKGNFSRKTNRNRQDAQTLRPHARRIHVLG